MKKVLIVSLAVLLAPFTMAELVSNYDFSAGDDGSWSYMSAWGAGMYNDGTDDIWYGGGWGNGTGGWSNTAIWQDTGAVFAADTEYTLSVEWRDPVGDGVVHSVMILLSETSGWTDVAAVWDGNLETEGEWATTTLTLDTTSNPSLVGLGIGVGFRLTEDISGTWVHINSISLVPEPATLALLGLGGLVIRRKRR